MTKTKRILSGLLALLTVVPMLAACSGGGDTPDDTTSADTSAAEAETTAASDIPELPDTTYDGHEFKVSVRIHNTHLTPYTTMDGRFNVEEMNGDVLNDSLHERNRKIEEKLDIVITDDAGTSTSPGAHAEIIRKMVQSGDNTYDIVFGSANKFIPLAYQNIFVELSDVEYIDLDHRVWDQNSIEDLSIGDSIFGVTGDIYPNTLYVSWMVTVDKKLQEDYKLDDPYDFVNDGSWTFDKFSEMSQSVTSDLDGNGTMDLNDLWGAASNKYVFPVFMIGGNAPFSTKDSDNLPVISFDNERFATVYSKLYDMIFTGESFFLGDGGTESDVFEAGRTLFFAVLYRVMFGSGRIKDGAYGVVPFPKADEAQENYITPMYEQAELMFIPTTNTELERTGHIVSALAYESTDTVQNAFFEITSKEKLSHDEHSREMIDLISATRMYDQLYLFNWANFSGAFINHLNAKNQSISSLVESTRTIVQGEIDKVLDAYAAME